LETQQFLAEHGKWTVVDQIDPARVEEEIVHAEAEKWPGWQKIPGRIPEEYFRRLEAEWQLAHRVIVNSTWSQTALIRQGVPAEKIVVVPLCYEASPAKTRRRSVGAEPTITVLWIGQVNLRKGIQYLIEAARALQHCAIRFIVAGPLGISQEAQASAPSNVKFVGSVSRDQVAELYLAADLFVIPTLSDGFAITQLEAMAHGLPVIATNHCGEVVVDGENGRIVPAADGLSLAQAIESLAADRRALVAMSLQAIETAQRFSINEVARRLDCLLRELACGLPTAAAPVSC
jgi:glycosyltransferase involved in cell wall biosynthesis